MPTGWPGPIKPEAVPLAVGAVPGRLTGRRQRIPVKIFDAGVGAGIGLPHARRVVAAMGRTVISVLCQQQPGQAGPHQGNGGRILAHGAADRTGQVAALIAEHGTDIVNDGFDREFLLQVVDRPAELRAVVRDIAFDLIGGAGVTCHCKPP